jgi:hypothetical protein
MKVQVQANYWHRIINYYHNILNERFMGQVYTATVQHFMQQVFKEEVRQARMRETHAAWHVPLELKFEPLKNSFFIEPASETEFEFI